MAYKPSKNWKSIYIEQPKDGEIVASRISYEGGYNSSTIWDEKTKTFRTYKDNRNRFEITIWKHDEWQRK